VTAEQQNIFYLFIDFLPGSSPGSWLVATKDQGQPKSRPKQRMPPL
jgi:uncharacterized pyridoxamine 5'-phosphate oxidase family protein